MDQSERLRTKPAVKLESLEVMIDRIDAKTQTSHRAEPKPKMVSKDEHIPLFDRFLLGFFPALFAIPVGLAIWMIFA